VALSLPGPEGKRFAAAHIYDWTLAHSKKPEMAINYFFARMGLFGGAGVNFGAIGRLAVRRPPRSSLAPSRATYRLRMHRNMRSSSI
jgi:hypothetical protein